MVSRLLNLLVVGSLLVLSQCHSLGRDRHGLIGYGINMYSPLCCTACRNVLSASKLNCSVTSDMDMDGMAGMDMGDSHFETEPECFATDEAYLLSMAVCIDRRCPTDPSVKKIKDWEFEQWWQIDVVGRASVQPDPKYTYQQALAQVKTTPTEVLVSGDPLNRTMLVADEDYQSNWNADAMFEHAEVFHERYALIVFLSGVVIPVGLSLLRFVPFPRRWITLFNAWIIDPPATGTHHKVPILWGLTVMPTRGQALFITYLTVINVILCATGYKSTKPNAWWPSGSADEILTYVTNRTGVLSFANIPLLILYAGRNNVLLWITHWSHETFLLLHRYIAAIATLQAIIHSIIYLRLDLIGGTYASESKLAYWIWGAAATIGMSVLLPTSILPIRRKIYEAFLLWHIAVSVIVVAGCYLHIYHRFQHQWGYEVWIYVAMAVWVFDRLLRVGRTVGNGLRWATISIIDQDYIRVDIEGVGGSGHAYLYFPTLTWRIWENHPFSVASTVLNTHKSTSLKKESAIITDVEKTPTAVVNTASSSRSSNSDTEDQPPKLAMTFLVRTRGGLTSLLRTGNRIPVFVESPYAPHTSFSQYPTLICIVGGVGITTVLPLLRAHPGRSRLLWGVRTMGIVDAMASDLENVDKTVFVGRRMVVKEELEKELNCAAAGRDAVVVVSGPDGMADDVRNAVCEIVKRNSRISVRLVEESFSW